MFQRLVEARDRLLASIGTSAPAPKPPAYAPKGAHLVYRSVRVSGARPWPSRGISVATHLAGGCCLPALSINQEPPRIPSARALYALKCCGVPARRVAFNEGGVGRTSLRRPA
jgi:hypothetical protein